MSNGNLRRPTVSTASLVVGGFILAGSFTAQAADLGRACCADLEERIAELEATTARKGNRKVSLKISGWVNEQLFAWDDSVESNVYVNTNDQERSRFKFSGKAKITDDWSAGYTLEVGVRGNRSSRADQFQLGATNALDVRKSSWYLKSKHLGKFLVGHDGTATYHLLDASDITNTRYHADAESLPTIGIANFFIVSNGVTASTLRWGRGVGNGILPAGSTNTTGNGTRLNIVRYDSSTLAGFSVTTAWGEDDMWDVALKYKGKIGDFEVVGRVGYAQYTDETTGPCDDSPLVRNDCAEWGGSATIWHKPSGLYVYGAYGGRHDPQRSKILGTAVDDNDTTWYIQLGIENKWSHLGKTTIFGTYRHDDVGANAAVFADANLGIVAGSYIDGSEIDTWGGGVVQHIEAAVMDLYLIYYNANGKFSTISPGDIKTNFDVDEFQILQFGGRTQF